MVSVPPDARVLITGMSGTGKSSVIDALRGRGFNAIDIDEPGWSRFDDEGNQLWIETSVQQALDTAGQAPLFLSGCAENQVKFYPRFTDVILLSAPRNIIIERLKTRSNNPYGKSPEQLEAVLNNLEMVEPLLRRGATREIETVVPLERVLDDILAHVSRDQR